MSKLSASEFQTWDSLYWPEGVPRILSVAEKSLRPVSEIPDSWHFDSPIYSTNKNGLVELIDLVTESIKVQQVGSCIAVQNSDPLGMLISILIPLRTGISCMIVPDALVGKAPCSWILRRVGSTGAPRSDYQVESLRRQEEAESLGEPSVSILHSEEVQITYPASGLMMAAASLGAFMGLSRAKGVAILASPQEEFAFFVASASLSAGVPLILLENISKLRRYPESEISAIFIGGDVAASVDVTVIDDYREQLRQRRKFISYLVMEGPVSAKKTTMLEKATGIPVLQTYGISGRGIILANPQEFNVHGSVGIPITNTEAVIADNWEGNWTRDRILMGPGVDGELIVRGGFIDNALNVGDSRQNAVKLRILDKSTEWLATSITGSMDENGYFYLNESSFR